MGNFLQKNTQHNAIEDVLNRTSIIGIFNETYFDIFLHGFDARSPNGANGA
jgi:hypothetical protein